MNMIFLQWFAKYLAAINIPGRPTHVTSMCRKRYTMCMWERDSTASVNRWLINERMGKPVIAGMHNLQHAFIILLSKKKKKNKTQYLNPKIENCIPTQQQIPA